MFVSHMCLKLSSVVAFVITEVAHKMIDIVDFPQMFFEQGFICDFVVAQFTIYFKPSCTDLMCLVKCESVVV